MKKSIRSLVDRSPHNLELLAMAQAVLGGIMAATAGMIIWVNPSTLQNGASTVVLALVGTVAVGYYFSVHHFIRKNHLQLSSLILSIITALNIGLLIIQTGGPDSAFYSFWLLVIVIAGIFGRAYIYGAAAGSLVFYLLQLPKTSPAQLVTNHAGQLLATLVAAVISQWVYSRYSQARAVTSQAATRVGEEQVRALALMNSLREGVMVIDAQRRVVLLNPAGAALTGWDSENAKGLDSRLIFRLKASDDSDIPPERDPFAEAWHRGQGVVKNSLTLLTKSNRRLAVSVSVSPLFDVNRNVTGAIVLFRDTSSERETERQRSEFISTASHEMRTPIAAIEGYISLAMNPNVATIDDKARGYLDKAHVTILHLGDLFKDLLSAAKFEEGGVIEKMEPVELGGIIKEVVDNLHFAAQKKGIGLEYHTSSGPERQVVAPLYFVKANPERLREVITNLVDNAIKFTSQGKVTVSIFADKDLATVSVKDSGAGIAPEDIPHLFQKFYRVDNSATRTTGGTGLGLYLCRNIIERYQGRIWVESALGQGSTFSFNLPRLSTQQVEAARQLVSHQAVPAR